MGFLQSLSWPAIVSLLLFVILLIRFQVPVRKFLSHMGQSAHLLAEEYNSAYKDNEEEEEQSGTEDAEKEKRS
jgi:hypothetical protein